MVLGLLERGGTPLAKGKGDATKSPSQKPAGTKEKKTTQLLLGAVVAPVPPATPAALPPDVSAHNQLRTHTQLSHLYTGLLAEAARAHSKSPHRNLSLAHTLAVFPFHSVCLSCPLPRLRDH
jgi:hypothetical protein